MPDAIDDILKKALPFLLGVAPTIFMLIFIIALGLIFSFKNRNRKNPLTQKLLRSPGQTLLALITELQFKIMEVFFLWCIIPPFAYMASLSAIAAQKSPTLLLLTMSIAILISLYGALKAYFILKRLADLRLAYDGELALGQELNELMLDGFRVYHDIQAEDFNIDHAVVGSSGVFAIETKTRSKKLQTKGAEAVEVLYDGDSINFPHWRDTKILEQARGNARWLEQRITAAVGDQVTVFPAVAIPGWYTKKTTNKSGPIVYNGKNPRAIFPKCGQDKPLTKEQINRIAYQIEQLCRNVAPITFSKKNKL
ncbi:MAG: nuclease-related domain-containing protein [Thermodesulfovibrionales bacterium]